MILGSCRTLIESDGTEIQTFKYNMSLYDETEKTRFVVTITNLSMEDSGLYGCGINTSHLIARVNLMVIAVASKHLERNRTRESPNATATPGTEGSSIAAATYSTGSRQDNTGSPSHHTRSRLQLVHLAYVGGVIATLVLTSGILVAFKCRTTPAGTGTPPPDAGEAAEDPHFYEQISLSDLPKANIPASAAEPPRMEDPLPLTDLITSSGTSRTPEHSAEPNYSTINLANIKLV
ncbi:CMRF35-like molecule 1 [Trichomycterus rosablanca]|uniref:CMRF35-like molecule 1 n=1 Tax=Trichomycterus rosablanca TaxID=2290929 RepID=UPI002F350D91